MNYPLRNKIVVVGGEGEGGGRGDRDNSRRKKVITYYNV